MGQLSDFFIATPSEVESFDLDELPAERFPTLQLKGIDDLGIATLHTILLGEPVDDVNRVVARCPEPARMHEEPETGIAIYELDGDLVRRLASSTNVERVAARWADTDEMRQSWEPAELATVLGKIRELVARPLGPEQRVYLWVSL